MNQPQSQQEVIEAIGGLIGLAIGVVIWLAIAITVCALLYGALKRVPAQHRKMEPGLVWLLLIPVFNYIWNFFVFLKIPESYQDYFRARGRADVGDCGKTLGLWYSILSAVSIGSCIPVLGCVIAPVSLAALVLLIIFLVKVLTLKGQIRDDAGGMMPPVVMG